MYSVSRGNLSALIWNEGCFFFKDICQTTVKSLVLKDILKSWAQKLSVSMVTSFPLFPKYNQGSQNMALGSVSLSGIPYLYIGEIFS